MNSVSTFRQQLDALQTSLNDTQKSQIAAQTREMNDRLYELERPQFLSQQRKEALIARIEAIFLDIPKILNPVHLKNSDILYRDCERLKSLRAQFSHLALKEVKRAFKELSPAVFSKVLHLVWLYSGAPRKTEFSQALLESGDLSIFYREFQPIIG